MSYPSLKEMTVLLVENDETTRNLLNEVVNSHAKDVYLAEDGEVGIALYKEKRPDFVVTNIRLLKKDGLDMAQVIKSYDAEAKIIISSATFDHAMVTRAKDIGVFSFVNQPVKAEELLTILEKKAAYTISRREFEKNKKLLEKYKEAVDVSALVSITDANGIITYVNDQFCMISGYSREELIGSNHSNLRHPEMTEEEYEDIISTIYGQKIWKGKVKNRRKDGSDYVVSATFVPIVDDNAKTVEYLALRQDITELELLNERLEERVAQEVKKNSQKDKALIESLEKIHDASPNPIIVYQHGKVSFANKRFLHISGLEHSALVGQPFDLSSIFEKRQGFITCVDDIDKSVDTNKISIAGKNGRNIFYVIENTVQLPMNESFEMFTFNNITLSEYQKIKMASYNSRLEDFIKGMGKKAGKSKIAQTIPSTEESKTLEIPAAVSIPVIESEKIESIKSTSNTPENGRKLSENEREVLKRSRLNAEISSADYAAEIDDYVLEEMQELGELETEINEALTVFEDEKCVKPLQQVAGKLTKYASTINQLFEFGDLAFSIDSLANLLMMLKDEDLNDIKVRKIELYLSNILLDISNWRRTIFVDQSANDIHYLDASLFSAILQLELVLNEGQKIDEDDDDDFELF